AQALFQPNPAQMRLKVGKGRSDRKVAQTPDKHVDKNVSATIAVTRNHRTRVAGAQWRPSNSTPERKARIPPNDRVSHARHARRAIAPGPNERPAPRLPDSNSRI